MNPKKMANNILEFMFDPTVIPVEKRLYFRSEENLQNQAFEKAKAESYASFGDQRQNSNFYPTRNKTEREASMDRKSLIASLDVLSQNFDESDPIGKDLRTMAYAVAHMGEEEYGSRMAKGKAEMVECPTCGGKVLKATSYCLKCKKKIDKMASAEEKCEDCGKEPCACGDKEASVEVVNDFWSKEASAAVQHAIMSDVLGSDDEEKEEAPAPKEEPKEEEAPAPKAPKAPKEEAPKAPKEEAPAPVEEEVKEALKDKKIPEEVVAPKEVVDEKDATVDTNILAYDGIEMEASMGDEVELTDSDRAQLDMLFK